MQRNCLARKYSLLSFRALSLRCYINVSVQKQVGATEDTVVEKLSRDSVTIGQQLQDLDEWVVRVDGEPVASDVLHGIWIKSSNRGISQWSLFL
jgi:hypothetical protein